MTELTNDFMDGRGLTRRKGRKIDGGKMCGAVMLALLLTAGSALGKPPKSGPEPMLFVVMDPLAKELACACVKGYAQRDYRKVATRLEKAIKQHVRIEFSDDLAESMAGVSPGREVIVVGDQSLVADGAKKAGLKCHPSAN